MNLLDSVEVVAPLEVVAEIVVEHVARTAVAHETSSLKSETVATESCLRVASAEWDHCLDFTIYIDITYLVARKSSPGSNVEGESRREVAAQLATHPKVVRYVLALDEVEVERIDQHGIGLALVADESRDAEL